MPNNKTNNIIITNKDINDKAQDFNNYFANVGRIAFEECKNNFTNNNANSDNARVTHDTIDNLDSINLFRPIPVNVETVILTISRLKETSERNCNITVKIISKL